MTSFVKWFKIIRPGTLAAAISPVAVGLTVASLIVPSLDWLTAVVTMLTAIGIQIASNLINDYYDFRRGLDKSGRVGPKRAIAEGTVTERQMKNAILIDLALTVVGGCYLVYVGGWPIIVIGLTALLFAWLYTATSRSLSYLGIADLFVLVYFGPVAVCGTAYLQTGAFEWSALWLGLVNGLISMGVLTVNNIRDLASDAEAGKRTLPVRIGKLAAEWEYLAIYLCAIPCIYVGNGSVLSYLTVLVGILLFFMLRKAEGARYNKLLIFTGLSNLLFALLIVVGRLFGI